MCGGVAVTLPAVGPRATLGRVAHNGRRDQRPRHAVGRRAFLERVRRPSRIGHRHGHIGAGANHAAVGTAIWAHRLTGSWKVAAPVARLKGPRRRGDRQLIGRNEDRRVHPRGRAVDSIRRRCRDRDGLTGRRIHSIAGPRTLADDEPHCDEGRQHNGGTHRAGNPASTADNPLLDVGHGTATESHFGRAAAETFGEYVVDLVHFSSSFKRVLARLSDDFTVPMAMPSVSAISASVDCR